MKFKLKKITILFIILDLLALTGFIAMYGPNSKIKNLYIMTASKTMNHSYLSNVFYSNKTIEKVINSNYLIPIDEDLNLDDIVIDNTQKKEFLNKYEKELLTRDEDNELYKIIELKIGNSKAHLVAIYDPTKVKLIHTQKFNAGGYGERILTMCERYGGVVCINGGGFEDKGYGSDVPIGYIIKDGKIVWSPDNEGKSEIIGMTKEGKLLLINETGTEAIKKGVIDGMNFGPFLIVNGKPITIVGDPWGRSPRVAIAQRKDGVMMFLVVDGSNYIDGATLQEVVDTLLLYGAYNAANLDGGQSSSLTENNVLLNNPPAEAKKTKGRAVVSGWGIIP